MAPCMDAPEMGMTSFVPDAGADNSSPLRFGDDRNPEDGLNVLMGKLSKCRTLVACGPVLAWGLHTEKCSLGFTSAGPSQPADRSGKAAGLFPLPVIIPKLDAMYGTSLAWQEDLDFSVDCWLAVACAALNRLYGCVATGIGRKTGKVHAAAFEVLKDKIRRLLAGETPNNLVFEDVVSEMKEKRINYTGEEVSQPMAISVEQIEKGLPPEGHGGSVRLVDFLSGRTKYLMFNPLESLLPVGEREVIPLQAKVISKADEKTAWWQVYLDNFMSAERTESCQGELNAQLLGEAMDAWESAGVLTAKDKQVLNSPNVTELGVRLDGISGLLGASPERLLKTIWASSFFLQQPRWDKKLCQVVLGRPRLAWCSVELFEMEGITLWTEKEYVRCYVTAPSVPTTSWIRPGWSWPADDGTVKFPTFMKSIKRKQPPPVPAGDHTQTDAEDAQLVQWIRLRDYSISAATKIRYEVAVGRILPFLEAQNDLSNLDLVLCDYIEMMWTKGESLYFISDGLSGLHFFWPEMRGLLRNAWRMFKNWRRIEAPIRAPPITVLLVRAVVSRAVQLNQIPFACMIALGFHVLLRTGELLQVASKDLELSAECGILSLHYSKSGLRAGGKEAVAIRDQLTLQLLDTWRADLFADSHGGLAPIPQAVPSLDTGTPVVPQTVSAKIRCLDLRLDEPFEATSGELQLSILEPKRVDSLLLCWEVGFESGEGWTGESLQALPARLEILPAGHCVDLQWHCNLQRVWFEVPQLNLFATAPLPRVFLLDWYAQMLNDAARNVAFERGLQHAVGEGGRVVDLGCGCGLLTRLALRQGAQKALAVEIAPHLARLARRMLPEAEVICGDLRAVMVDEAERFDVVVAELLDAGGLGEKIVPFLRHAKSRLLRPGGYCIPRRLRIRSVLLDVHLSKGQRVDLAAWEPFWLPARASRGEWLGIDLDAGAEWQPASNIIDLFDLNFEGSHSDLIEALQEREHHFELLPDANYNAVAWWFEADLGIGEPGSCDLTSAPRRFRPANCDATHWVQAVAGLGRSRSGRRSLAMRVRTDGVQITWLPEEEESSSSPLLDAWRQQAADADQTLRDLERHLDTGGDVARLAALKSAALCLAAQPRRFGLEATPEVVSRLLKALFVTMVEKELSQSKNVSAALGGVWGSSTEAESSKSSARIWRDEVISHLSAPRAVRMAGVFQVVDARDFAKELADLVPADVRSGDEVLVQKRLTNFVASVGNWLAPDDALVQEEIFRANPTHYVLVVADSSQLTLATSGRFLHKFYVSPFVAQQRRNFLKEKLLHDARIAAARIPPTGDSPKISVLMADAEQFYHDWEFWRRLWECTA
eukprot:s2058_g15.t1